MKILQLNHVALHVTDVKQSAAFYRDVLGLKAAPRPSFGFDGAWFHIGDASSPAGLQELHLICREMASIPTPPRERHMAFLVEDIAAVDAELTAKGVAHAPPKPRPDGAMQIFLQDPDGHMIELCSCPTNPAR